MPTETSALPFDVEVECHAGYRGEETPRRFHLAGRGVEIGEVLDCWLAPDHRYFKVRDGQGHVYILRNDVTIGRWELTFFRQRTSSSSNSS
jgi:hypothetical protein